MSQGLAWDTAAAARTRGVIDEIPGGWSALLRLLLENLMLGPRAFATAGFPATIGGRSHLVFANLKNAVAEGDGARQVLRWPGSGDLKPCLKNFNTRKKAWHAQRDDPKKFCGHAASGPPPK